MVRDERELSNNIDWPISVNEGGTIESHRRTFTGFNKCKAQHQRLYPNSDMHFSSLEFDCLFDQSLDSHREGC